MTHKERLQLISDWDKRKVSKESVRLYKKWKKEMFIERISKAHKKRVKRLKAFKLEAELIVKRMEGK